MRPYVSIALALAGCSGYPAASRKQATPPPPCRESVEIVYDRGKAECTSPGASLQAKGTRVGEHPFFFVVCSCPDEAPATAPPPAQPKQETADDPPPAPPRTGSPDLSTDL